MWDKVVESLRVEMGYSQGRTLPPSAAIIDTQSVKTAKKGDKRLQWSQKDKGVELWDTQGNFI
jgi:hypothetical protein